MAISQYGNQGWGGSMQGPNQNRRAGWSGPSGMVNPATWKSATPSAPPPQAASNPGVSANPWNPTQSFAGPGGINPALGKPNMPIPPQNYFGGIPPWGGNQSQLSMQNPMLSMGGGQGGQMFPPQWGGQQGNMQPYVQRMQGGQQRGFPANQPTSNPYMPQMQQPQPQPQQMPANPYNPFQSSQGWNQSGQFPGFRFPAY